MPATQAAEPIALRDSLSELMDLFQLRRSLQGGQKVELSPDNVLRGVLQLQWRALDNAVAAKRREGRFSDVVEHYLDLHETARDVMQLLIQQLEAAGLNGKARYQALCQEREPLDLNRPEVFEEALCVG